MLKNRATGWLALVAAMLTLGFAAMFTTPSTAYASTGKASVADAAFGNQYDYIKDGVNAYVNAWNGGPEVNVYESQTTNNDFTVYDVTYGGSTWNILEDTAGNANNGNCVGNYQNEEGDERSGLDSDCSSADPGWGAKWIEYGSGDGCPNGYVAFKNEHSGGWLGPVNGYSNGSAFYNNNLDPVCFAVEGAG